PGDSDGGVGLARSLGWGHERDGRWREIDWRDCLGDGERLAPHTNSARPTGNPARERVVGVGHFPVARTGGAVENTNPRGLTLGHPIATGGGEHFESGQTTSFIVIPAG